jgi:hypothetical protein
LLQVCEDLGISRIEEKNFPGIFWRLSVKLFVDFQPSLLRLDVGQAKGVKGLLPAWL